MTSAREPRAAGGAGEARPDPADPAVGAAESGRPVVLEPTPPGLWGVLLGAALATLAPLFGFLIGGIIGVGDGTAAVDPMSLSLFLGVVVGGVGVVVAIIGGIRLWRHLHPQEVAAEAAGLPPEAARPGR